VLILVLLSACSRASSGTPLTSPQPDPAGGTSNEASASTTVPIVVVVQTPPPTTSASSVPPPPHSPLCANATNRWLSECDELVARLRPRVAKPILECLRTANSGGPPDAYACVQNRLSSTKADPLAEADCDRLAKLCAGKSAPKHWRARCSKQFSALTARGRDAVVVCMSANECEGLLYFDEDVGSCVFDDHPA